MSDLVMPPDPSAAKYPLVTYVNDGIVSAMAQAKAAAKDKNVMVHGAYTAQRALEAGADCGAVLQQIAAIRGAVNGLMSEVLEAHIREEFGQAASSAEQRDARVTELASLVRSYLK